MQTNNLLRPLSALWEDPRVGTAAAGLFAALVAMAVGDMSLMVLLLVPVVLVGVAASIRFPLIALSVLVIVIVTHASQNLIINFGLPSIAKLAAPAMCVLFAARYFIYKEIPYIGWLAITCLTVMFAMKLGSAIYADDWNASIDDAVAFLKDMIFALLALGFVSQRRGFETITMSACLAVAFVCALGIYQLVFGRDPGSFYGFSQIIPNSGRFSGPLEDANFFGAIIVFTIPLALFQVMNARRVLWFLFWSVVAVCLIAGLFATNSRGGLIGLCFGLLIMGTGLSRRQFLGFAALLSLTAVLSYTFVTPETREHFATIIGVAASGGETGDTSTEGRLASWEVAVALFKDYPLLGVGVGNFKQHYQSRALELGLIFRGEGRSTHSLYLEFLAEQGIIGLGIVIGFLGIAATNIIRAVKLARMGGDERLARHMSAFGAGIAGYLFAMIFLQDSFPRFLWFVVALAIEAKMIVVYHQRKKSFEVDDSSALQTRN